VEDRSEKTAETAETAEPEAAGFEIEHGHDAYAVAELLEQAQSNAQAAIIATAAFLDERGLAGADWAEAIGRRFATGWDAPRPWDAGEFLDAMLTNYRALGARVVSVDLAAERAEAVTTGFPDPALCALFGVPVPVAAVFNDAAGVIARERDLSWTWRLDGDRTHYLTARAGGERG
jgi:hypothetical protein